MTRSVLRQFGNRILRRLAPSTALVLWLSLTGCANQTLRGNAFPEDDWSSMPKSMRPADEDRLPTAYSNKARQIERNLGIE